MSPAAADGGRRPHEGAVAIVTGASRGIGLGIAARLVADGAQVVITARKPEPLAAAVAELGGPAAALGIAGNAADPAHIEEVVAAARATFGGLDHLVNNTGINPHFGPMLDADADVVRKIFDSNVIAAAQWLKTALAEALYVGHEEQVASAYPMKRLGMPADIAGAVSFLLSRDAGWITGQTLVVDGGVTLGGAL